MRSFISSFKAPLRFAAIGLALFLAYNVLLLGLQDRIGPGPLASIAEGNQADVESYLRDGRKISLVITGSSLSATLPAEAFPQGAVSLTQSGGTALTGLDVIAASGAHPRTILVEVNYLFRPRDEAMVRHANNHFSSLLANWVPSFQVRFRPVNLMLNLVRSVRDRSGGQSADQSVGTGAYEAAVAASLSEMNKPVDQRDLSARMHEVREMIDGLRQNGTQIVLVEMPIDPRLRSSARMRQVFDAAEQAMPEGRYTWFHPPPGDYRTVDGEHMMKSRARRFAEMLAGAV